MKEIVETVGSDKGLYLHAEKKMKAILSELYVMKRTQNHTNTSKRSIDENSEWVSCNVLMEGKSGQNKKQKYYISQG